ncbi:hypothetical protein NDU88_003326 [Pleurodeles waltl]|uniref:Uncharacterized protein n=1 Tax=Pleurodeles waltl TaxID=8319 RepID=A0AAV7KUJ9_PLEWA|nr:hypothetical protein NDU88_003326 [Pleurodeles waltl]
MIAPISGGGVHSSAEAKQCLNKAPSALLATPLRGSSVRGDTSTNNEKMGGDEIPCRRSSGEKVMQICPKLDGHTKRRVQLTDEVTPHTLPLHVQPVSNNERAVGSWAEAKPIHFHAPYGDFVLCTEKVSDNSDLNCHMCTVNGKQRKPLNSLTLSIWTTPPKKSPPPHPLWLPSCWLLKGFR